MSLTALAIKAAKPQTKVYKLSDAKGLHILVAASGAKYWRMNYRFAGKFKTLALGVWPETSLAEARAKSDSARKLLEEGIDPSEKAKLDRISASIALANTFGMVAQEWIEKTRKDGFSAVTLKKNQWLLNQISPVLGKRPISEIKAPELLLALRKIENRGLFDTAQRLRSLCGQVFRYGIVTARCERDISTDLRGALVVHRVKHRAAITTPYELGQLLRAIDDFQGQALSTGAQS